MSISCLKNCQKDDLILWIDGTKFLVIGSDGINSFPITIFIDKAGIRGYPGTRINANHLSSIKKIVKKAKCIPV
jgi:hypothetical protein